MKLVALMLCGLLSLATAYPYPDEEPAKISHPVGTDCIILEFHMGYVSKEFHACRSPGEFKASFYELYTVVHFIEGVDVCAL